MAAVENSNDPASDVSDNTVKSRSPVSIRTILLGVVVAGVILGAIFVIDPEFLDGSAEVASSGSTDGEDSPQGQGGGRRRGGFDPAAIFAERDQDGNGIIEGEEISERMAGRLEQLDGNGDGAVSEDEFMTALANRGGRGRGAGGEGGGGSGAAGGRGRPGRPGGRPSEGEDETNSEPQPAPAAQPGAEAAEGIGEPGISGGAPQDDPSTGGQ